MCLVENNFNLLQNLLAYWIILYEEPYCKRNGVTLFIFSSFYVNSSLPRDSPRHLISKSKSVSLIHNYSPALERMAIVPQTYIEKVTYS